MNKVFKNFILKDLKYNRNDTAMIILCESILIAVAYAGAAGYQMFIGGHQDESFLMFDSVNALFASASKIFLLCALVLIITLAILYLSKRVPTYILLKRMGISTRDFKSMVGIEVLVTYIVSVVSGIVMGIILSIAIKAYVVRQVDIGVLGNVSILTIPIICLGMLCMYALGFLLVKELESDFLIVSGASETTRTERMRSKLDVAKIIIGCAFCIYPAYSFSKPYNAESAWLIVMFFAGAYLLLKTIWMIHLDSIRQKKQEKYYRNLLKNNRWYFRSKTLSKSILVCTVISFLGCFYFGFQAVSILNSENAESLYPYDFMVLATQDDSELLKEIRNKYDAEVEEYPMVRVSNYDKTEQRESGMATPIQGQQIGISESTYNKLKSAADPDYKIRSLGLDAEGEKVYIVHQQDESIKAQPLDWHYSKSKPNLHIGVPAYRADSGQLDETYPEKKVVGEEFGSITGIYSTSKCENIVVFSDKYFKKAQGMWKSQDAITGWPSDRYKEIYQCDPTVIEGPSTLALIRVDKSNSSAIDSKLESLEEAHDYVGNYDSTVRFHYRTDKALNDLKSERAVRLMISIYFIVIMLIVNYVALFTLNKIEAKERKERCTFLNRIGMERGLINKLRRRELLRYYIMPSVFLVVSTAIFYWNTVMARQFDKLLIRKCASGVAGIVAMYIVFSGIFCIILYIMNRKEISGTDD